MSLEEVFDNGIRVENLPKTMNFLASTQKVNQIVNADLVKALAEVEQQRNRTCSVEDSLMVTSNLNMMPIEPTNSSAAAHTHT